MRMTSSATEALAINGGSPVRKTLLPYGRQSIDEDDIQAVVDVLRSAWLTTGPKVEEFEEAFAARVGAKRRSREVRMPSSSVTPVVLSERSAC